MYPVGIDFGGSFDTKSYILSSSQRRKPTAAELKVINELRKAKRVNGELTFDDIKGKGHLFIPGGALGS